MQPRKPLSKEEKDQCPLRDSSSSCAQAQDPEYLKYSYS